MRKRVLLFLSGLIVFFFGVSILSLELMSFEYINQAPEMTMMSSEDVTEYVLGDENHYAFYSDDCYIELKENENIQDKVIVRVTYYPQYGSVLSTSDDLEVGNTTTKEFLYQFQKESYFTLVKAFSHDLLEDWKNHRFYNYSLVVYPHIIVEVNGTQKEQIKILGREEGKDDVFIESSLYD